MKFASDDVGLRPFYGSCAKRIQLVYEFNFSVKIDILTSNSCNKITELPRYFQYMATHLMLLHSKKQSLYSLFLHRRETDRGILRYISFGFRPT